MLFPELNASKYPPSLELKILLNTLLKKAKKLGITKTNEKVIVIMGSQEEEQEESDILTIKTVA